ncbi:MAG TPA: hypothetical protein VEW26_03360 [Allosphingosinicella sp.]|nr:hypothetical protein [Allosphingosinicella sp.]
MLERLMLHGAAFAREAAEERRARLAEAIRDEAPEGVRVSEAEQGVELEGRGLLRRFALEPGLRWLIPGRRR